MDINDKEKQIEELIEKMTTEEKVAQTLQLSYRSMSAEKFAETVQKGVLGAYRPARAGQRYGKIHKRG